MISTVTDNHNSSVNVLVGHNPVSVISAEQSNQSENKPRENDLLLLRNLEAGHVRTHHPFLLEDVVACVAEPEDGVVVGEVFLMNRVHVMKL